MSRSIALAVSIGLSAACAPTPYVPGEGSASDTGDEEVFLGADFDPTLVQAYALDVQSGFFAQPPLVGEMYKGDIDDFIVAVSDLTDEHAIAMRVAVSESPDRRPIEQAPCIETVEFPAIDWTANPAWAVNKGTTQLNIEGFEAEIMDLGFEGRFEGMGGSIEGVTLTGVVDTRHLVDLVEEGGADDTICVMAVELGAACVPCPDGTGDFCAEVRLEDMIGYPTDVDPVLRTAADVAADPRCMEP